MYKLTEREQKLFDYISNPANLRIAPFSELCKYMGIKSKSQMWKWIYTLKGKGYLRQDGLYYKLNK